MRAKRWRDFISVSPVENTIAQTGVHSPSTGPAATGRLKPQLLSVSRRTSLSIHRLPAGPGRPSRRTPCRSSAPRRPSLGLARLAAARCSRLRGPDQFESGAHHKIPSWPRVVRPTFSACAPFRQGTSLRSAPAPRAPGLDAGSAPASPNCLPPSVAHAPAMALAILRASSCSTNGT